MRRFLVPLFALTLASPVSAQDAGDDWDSLVQPENRLTVAYVEFGNGIGVATRCIDGGYEAMLSGLPPAQGERRPLLVHFSTDDAPYETQWNVAVDPTIAVSERPAAFARELRQGGQLQVVVPGAGEGGRNLRYVLDLPTSSASIDRTLTACGRPLDDPRDAELAALGETGLPGGVGWASRPRPRYPDGDRVYERGFAVVTCLSQPDGRLRACEVETEHPRDGGFGEAAIDATRRARLENIGEPGRPLPVRLIAWRTQFTLQSVMDAELENGRATRLNRSVPPSPNPPD